jgi:DNA replication and repair protein RecF
MTITSLNVRHVRTHTVYELQLSSGVTLITGPNGSGKTSLIEALYIALRGSSFKGGDPEILQQGAPWYRIDARFEDGAHRAVKFDPSRSTGRKQFIIDEKTHYRMPPSQKYPVVLFEPEDLRLINGSPTRRRQFIDRFISQLDPQYALSLRRYDRALKQRNTLLKRFPVQKDDLFAWDVSLSEYGTYIVDKRHEFIAMLAERMNTLYERIAHTGDTVLVRYSEKAHADTKQKLLSDLHAHSERDSLLGFTSTGPHRHDLLFEFNGSPALSVASRGETRSMVLALKFLEIELIEALTGVKPLILLDDVFSELDEMRQQYLASSTEGAQIIITSATADPGVQAGVHVSL